jgi:hypothetical protein
MVRDRNRKETYADVAAKTSIVLAFVIDTSAREKAAENTAIIASRIVSEGI